MSDAIAIKVDHVSKTFKLPLEKNTSIKSAVVNFYRRNKSYELQRALEDVSVEIKQGEFFGIVGRNGSGKSTLLKMLAGIYTPTAGSIQINGKLTPFIELGVGFSPELTGRENIYLNGALLGFSRAEMEEMYDDIVAFAELQKFMDQKLKNYSSGMQVRLAFSIAIRAQSDILVLDEVLAVGDAAFQKKCVETFRQLKDSGRTIILVSHSTGDIERFCDRVLVIDKGDSLGVMSPGEAIALYQRINIDETAKDTKVEKTEQRWGNGPLQHGPVSFWQAGEKTRVIRADGDLEIRMPITVKAPLDEDTHFQIGLAFYDVDRMNLAGPNSYKHDFILPAKQKAVVVSYKLPQFIFNAGEYKLTVAVLGKKGDVTYDHHVDAATFDAITEEVNYGKVILDGQWDEVKAA